LRDGSLFKAEKLTQAFGHSDEPVEAQPHKGQPGVGRVELLLGLFNDEILHEIYPSYSETMISPEDAGSIAERCRNRGI